MGYYKFMLLIMKSQVQTFFVFALITVLFLIKLDRYYFFTDEILYVQTGIEHFQGLYNDTLQVPPIPKYFAGAAYTLAKENVAYARIPYAFLGVFSAYLIYLIVKKEYNSYLGYIGALMFVTSRIIFDASRMIMLEPLLHLFLLLFLYFYYNTFTKNSHRIYLISGLFLGLSLSIKLTSLILLPFVLLGFIYKIVIQKVPTIEATKYYLYMVFTAAFTGLLGYLHFFYKSGIFSAIIETIKSIRDVYFLKSEEGKTHVIGGNIYEKSPWWTYFYYFIQNNGVFRATFYLVTLVFSLIKRNFFIYYWGIFLIFVTLFHQLSGVKNVRYISSIEIPIIVLSVAGINYFFEQLKTFIKPIYLKLFVSIVLACFILVHINYLNKLNYTEYAGLFRYFQQETSNFEQYKRMYAFGSVRSLKYYRDLVPNMNMLLWRKDYNVMCPEFNSFDYFAFDKEELLKSPDNFMFTYVQVNKANFEQVLEISDMYVYKKFKEFESILPCPPNE